MEIVAKKQQEDGDVFEFVELIYFIAYLSV